MAFFQNAKMRSQVDNQDNGVFSQIKCREIQNSINIPVSKQLHLVMSTKKIFYKSNYTKPFYKHRLARELTLYQIKNGITKLF